MKEISFKMNNQNTDEVIYEDSLVTIYHLRNDLYKFMYPNSEKWEYYNSYAEDIIEMYDWDKIRTFLQNQPERSKREDSQQCEMRCSEHCGNIMREAQ